MTTTASGLLCWRDFHPQEWDSPRCSCPRRADLSLANGAGCFHVNDDTELHVGGIVVGVRRMPAPRELRSTGPRNRSARRTSGQRRWRPPTPYSTSHVAARSKSARRSVALHFCSQRQVLSTHWDFLNAGRARRKSGHSPGKKGSV